MRSKIRLKLLVFIKIYRNFRKVLCQNFSFVFQCNLLLIN